MKPWLVVKFGGTSIGKFIDKIPDIIRFICAQRAVENLKELEPQASKSNTIHTIRLLNAAKKALVQGDYRGIIQSVLAQHLEASEVVESISLRNLLQSNIKSCCKRVMDVLGAVQVIQELSPRSKDLIAGTGELLACKLLCSVLLDKGISAHTVSLEKVIDDTNDRLNQTFFNHVEEMIKLELINKKDNKVPVITGFFGAMSQGLLNTVGRGYTDLTAALVAASLQAKELQIWKDVDGIFTADPNKLPGARLVPQITPEEAAELTFFGSVVIHPVAMQQAVRKQIPIRIKNVQDSKKNGTVIKADVGTRGAATAATIKEDVWVVNVQSNQQRVGHHFYSQVFQVLDAAKVDVDLISTSEVNVSMAISGYSRIPLHLLEAVGQVQVHKNMAIVSVVGQGMRSSIGLSARMLGSLSRAGINIEMISQGASEINISCVVDGRRAVDALKAVHKELLSS